jgi:hypothetical protein
MVQLQTIPRRHFLVHHKPEVLVAKLIVANSEQLHADVSRGLRRLQIMVEVAVVAS